MEPDAPEAVAIMKMDIKEIPGSQLGTVSDKSSFGELQEVEDEHCLLPGTCSSKDESKVVQSSRNGIVNLNIEGKASNFMSGNFSESPSLAIKNSEHIPKDSNDSEDIANPVPIETEDVSKFRGEQTGVTIESTGDDRSGTGKEASKEMSSGNARADDVGLLSASTLPEEQNHFINNGDMLPSEPIPTTSDDLNQQEAKTEEGNEPVVDDTEQKNEVRFDDKQGLDIEHLHSSDIIHHQNVEDSREITDDQRAERICGSMSTQDEAATNSEMDNMEDKKSDEDPDKHSDEDPDKKTDEIIAVFETPNKPLKEEANQPVLHKEESETKEKSSNFVSMVKDLDLSGDISPDITSHGASESEKTIIPQIRVTEEEGLQKSKAEENWLPDNTAPSLDEISVRAIESQKERKTKDATESETQDRDIIEIIQRVDDENDSTVEQSQINKEETEKSDKKVTDEMEQNDINPNFANEKIEGTLAEQANEEPNIAETNEDTEKDNKNEDCTIQDHATISTEEPQIHENTKENDEAKNLEEEVNEEQVTDGDEKHSKRKEEDAIIEAPPIEKASKATNQVIKGAENDAEEDTGESTIEEDIVPDQSTTTTGTEAVEDGNEKDKVFEGLEKVGMDKEEDVVDQSKATTEEETTRNGHGEEKVIAELEIAGVDHDAKQTNVEVVLKDSTTVVEKPHEDGHGENKAPEGSQINVIDKGIGEIIMEDDVPGQSETTIKDGHQEEKEIEKQGTKDSSETIFEEVAVLDHSTTTIEDEQIENGLGKSKVTGGSQIGDKEDTRDINVEKDIISNCFETITEEQPSKDAHEEEKVSKELLASADKSITEPIIEEIVALNPHATEIKDETVTDGQQENKVTQELQNDVGKDIAETIKEKDVQVHFEGTIEKEPNKDGYQDEKAIEDIKEAGADKEKTEIVREEIVSPEHSIAVIEDEPTEDEREELKEKDVAQDHSQAIIEDEQLKDGNDKEKVNEELEIANAEEIPHNPILEDVIVSSDYTKNTEDEPSEVSHEENKVTGCSEMAGAHNDTGETIQEEVVIPGQPEPVIPEKPINDGQGEEKVIEELELVGANKDNKKPIIEEFIDQNKSTTIITDEPVQDGEAHKAQEESQIDAINNDVAQTITEEEIVSSHSEISIMINDHEEEKEVKRQEIAGADKDNRESTSVIPENENEPTTDGHEDKINEGSQYAGLVEDIKESITEEDVVPNHYDTTTGEKPVKYVQEEDKVTWGLEIASANKENKDSNTKENVNSDYTTPTIGKEAIEDVAETVGSGNEIGEPIAEEDVVIHQTTTIGDELNNDGREEAKEIEEDDISNNSTITEEEQTTDGKEENKVFSKDRDIGAPTIGDVGVPDYSTCVEDELIKEEYQEDKVHESLKEVVEVEDTKKEVLEDDNAIDLLETSTEEETQKNICQEFETTGDACATEPSTVSDRVETSMEDPQEDKIEAEKDTEAEQYKGSMESTSEAPDSMEKTNRLNLELGEEQHMYQNAGGVMETTVEEEVQKTGSDDVRDTSSEVNFKESDTAEQIERMNFNGEDLLKNQTAASIKGNTETIQDKSSEMLGEASSLPEASEEERNEEIIDDKKDTNNQLNTTSLEKEKEMICLHESENNTKNISQGHDTGATINYIETTAPEKEQGSTKTTKENPVEEIERTEVIDHLRDQETQTKQVVAYSDLASVQQAPKPDSENKYADGLSTTNQVIEDPAKEIAGVIQEEKVHDEDKDIPEAEHNIDSCEMSTELDNVIPESREEKGIDLSSTLTPKSELESVELEIIDGSYSPKSIMDINGDDKTTKEQSSTANFDADAVEGEDTHEMDIAEENVVNDQRDVLFRDEAVDQSRNDDEQENIESKPEEKAEDPIAADDSTITKTQNEEVIDSPEVARESMEIDKYIIQEQEAPGDIETVSAGDETKQFLEDSVSTQPSSAFVEDVNIGIHGEQLHETMEATTGEEAVERLEISAEESCMASLEEQAIKESSQEAEVYGDIKKVEADDAGNQTMEYAADPDVSMILVAEQTAELSSHKSESENENENHKEQNREKVKHSDIVFTKEATASSNETKVEPLEEGDLKKSFNDSAATETSLKEISMMESCDNLNYTSTRSDMSETTDRITVNTSKNHEPTRVTLHEDNLSLDRDEEYGGGLVDATNLASVAVEGVTPKAISVEDNVTENTFIADNSDATEAEQEKSEVSDEAEHEKSEIPVESLVEVIQSVHGDIETTPKVETTSCKLSSDDMLEDKPQEDYMITSDKQEVDSVEMKEKIKDEFSIEDEIKDKRETPLLPETEGDVNIQNEERVKMDTEINEEKIPVPTNVEKDYLEKEKNPLEKLDQNIEESNKEIRAEETVVEHETTDVSSKIGESHNLNGGMTPEQLNLEAVVACDKLTTDTESVDHDQRQLELPETQKTEVVTEREIIKNSDPVSVGDHKDGKSIREDEIVEDVKHKAISLEDNATKNTFVADNSDATEAEQVKSEISNEAEQEKFEIPVETFVEVIQFVHKDIETNPKIETTSCKTFSDMSEDRPQETSAMTSDKQEIDTIEMKEKIKHGFSIEDETLLVAQREADVSIQNEESEKLEENKVDTEVTEEKIPVAANIEKDYLERERDPLEKVDKIIETSNKEISAEETTVEIEATEQSTQISEPHSLIEKVTHAQNLEAVPCDELTTDTKSLDHDQKHPELPETQETTVVIEREIIKHTDPVSVGDHRDGESINEDENVEDVKDKEISMEDNAAENTSIADKINAIEAGKEMSKILDEAEQEKSEIPEETFVEVIQSVHKDIGTTPKVETTSCKPFSDMSEDKTQDSSSMASEKQDFDAIEMKEKIKDEFAIEDEIIDKSEIPVVKQTEGEINFQNEGVKLEENKMDTEITEENIPDSGNTEKDYLERKEDPLNKLEQIIEGSKKEISAEETTVELEATDQSTEIGESHSLIEEVALAQNLEAVVPRDELTTDTESVDHDQRHLALPETQKTEVMTIKENIKDSDSLSVGDPTNGESMREDDRENKTLDETAPKLETTDKIDSRNGVDLPGTASAVNEEVVKAVIPVENTEPTESENLEKGDIVKEGMCESEEDQKKEPNEESETTEHVTLADEAPKQQDKISHTESNENGILGEIIAPAVSCQTAQSERSYTEIIEEDKGKKDHISDEVANEECVTKSNPEKDRTEETYEENAKLEDKISNQEVSEEHGNSGGIHDTVKHMIREGVLKDANLVISGAESVQKIREEKLEGARIEKESITLEPEKPYPEQGDLKTNEITQDKIVNDMSRSSQLMLEQKGIGREDLTSETGPFSVKDEEDKSRKCDALLIRDATSEEVSVEEGKQFEEETSYIPDEQIQEINTRKPENTETVSKDTSGPEGFVEFKKPSNSVFGSVTLNTTDNLHTKEDLPTDVISFKEASQEEKEEKSTKVEEKQEVLFITEPRKKVLEESRKNIGPEARVAEMSTKGVEIINEPKLQENLSANGNIVAQLSTHPDTPDATDEKLISMEADSDTRTKETRSVSRPSIPINEKHGETLSNDLEINKEISEAGKETNNLREEKGKDSKSLEESDSLFNILVVTKEETVTAVGEQKEEARQHKKEGMDNKEALTVEIKNEDKTDEKENDEGKEEDDDDEHKKDDSGSDAPVMVEASKDIVVKTTPKKSHNILSGVGSKVKHSISKVKKAITGKSSHQKQSSPK